MRTIPDLSTKTSNELAAGELAVTSGGGGRYLCMRMGPPEEPRAPILMIPTFNSDSGNAPLLLRPERYDSFSCLSYGAGWVLSFDFDELSSVNNRVPYGTPGVLFVSKDGPVLCVERQGHGSDFAFVNLQTSDVVSLPDNSWPTNCWSIFASEESYNHPRGEPIFRNVPQPQRRR